MDTSSIPERKVHKTNPTVITERKQSFRGTFYHIRKSGHYMDRKGVQLHRVVWEYHFGSIPTGMLIHHLDGNPQNNQVDNLALVTFSAHAKSHSPKRYKHQIEILKKIRSVSFVRDVKKTCKYCGKVFFVRRVDATRSKYCSRKCYSSASYKWGSGFRKGICPVCGKEFETKCRRTQTCSYKCGWALRRKN